MTDFVDGPGALSGLNPVTIPDLWQQDVVVQAPTGAGKTLIFELWSNQGRNHGQAIYTVPTRALANDKLAEWRACGWNVGIATGDLSENLGAPGLEWMRWQELQTAAMAILRETESPTFTELPRLDYQQTRRVEHCLQLRRH